MYKFVKIYKCVILQGSKVLSHLKVKKQFSYFTGGGSCSKDLSVLTDAVMSVVGRFAVNNTGIGGPCMDSTLLGLILE